MTKLICTIPDFHKFIGPRIRNVIQSMTKKRKNEINHLCQNCKQTRELEAAHIKGNSRKEIIEEILKKHKVNSKNNLIEIDLEKIEKEILQAHQPIEKYFKFLCSKCHTKYDKN